MPSRNPAMPLLLLPGLLCDEDVWAAQAEALGSTREVMVGPLGIDDTVDHLGAMARQLLAAIAAPRFAVAGHSMGGRIALEMLRQAPGRVGGLALLDSGTAARPDGAAGEAEYRSRHALVALARSQGMAAVSREWLPPMVHPAVIGTALFERMVAMVLRSNPARFAAQVQALLHRPDAEPVLRGVHSPVLLVCGEQDRWSPPERHRAMQALLPGSVLRFIGECGHMSPMEQPAAVSAALAQWLVHCDAAA
ncbi:alpha/beta hydrolase [Ideonella azotifigens]|uniref:Alpha/beta hydrolase n=1 Tax=Ideonella azotifigens TaxID=513160 RepID=A0ABN1JJJ6_9BURK|nr:alpha/beta fold hydrolase [Ideonella azotifigens]MCD2342009.1 alpha/beta hydrolase [Ideonella azotifigens]